MENGFARDPHFKKEFLNLIDAHQVRCVVETGTSKGSTTLELAKKNIIIHTIEVKEASYQEAKKKFMDKGNIIAHLGSSPEVLDKIIPELPVPTIFFLDAHWYSYNPLLDELRIIAKHGLRPIIIIHDFKVPDRPDFGFDSYKGQDYEWEWIRQAVEKIYGQDYVKWYNREAAGAKRGVIFLAPSDNGRQS